ncbi:MAG: FadR/GntR family transcriptional regulator [Beutenbergiaceae bacterium]
MNVQTGSGTNFSAVARVSPTQQVQEQLLAAIQNGEYPPGGKLPSERVLCETFGVSRVSVREALAGLAATGLIEVRQGRGAFVRQGVSEGYFGPFGRYIAMHQHELAELLQVRGALDGLAAASASQHASVNEQATLTAAHNAFEKGVDTGVGPVELSVLDVAFHQRIAQIAGNGLLEKLIGELHSLLNESRHILFAREGQPERSRHDHSEILQAILARDGDKAQAYATEHARKMQDWIAEFRSGPDMDKD